MSDLSETNWRRLHNWEVAVESTQSLAQILIAERTDNGELHICVPPRLANEQREHAVKLMRQALAEFEAEAGNKTVSEQVGERVSGNGTAATASDSPTHPLTDAPTHPASEGTK